MSRKERAAWLQKYAVAHYAKKYSHASRTNPGDMCLCAFVPGPIAVVRLPNIRLHVRCERQANRQDTIGQTSLTSASRPCDRLRSARWRHAKYFDTRSHQGELELWRLAHSAQIMAALALAPSFLW